MTRPLIGDEKAILLTITMPKNIVKAIDKTRGLMPRSLYLRQLAQTDLEERQKKRLQGLQSIGANQEEASQAAEIQTVPQPKRDWTLDSG